MSSHDLYQEWKELVTLRDREDWDSLPPAVQFLLFNRELSDAIIKTQERIGSFDDPAPVIEAAVQMYDDYVVPIDFPPGEMIESIAERYVRGLIPELVTQIFNEAKKRLS